jgi:hypothetical protein
MNLALLPLPKPLSALGSPMQRAHSKSCASGIPVLLLTFCRLAGGDSADCWLSDPFSGDWQPSRGSGTCGDSADEPRGSTFEAWEWGVRPLTKTADAERAHTKILLKNRGPRAFSRCDVSDSEVHADLARS